jgi:hypothetical protein
MKAIVVTDAHGKVLGAHRNVPIKTDKGMITFFPVTNHRQKSHEVEVDEKFFSRPAAELHNELARLVAAGK